ncbi:MarR family transcriptional regulator [Massilia solisilvae]|uniref:MarR family transcriptional regulator n=1 Tax=Massilia solisilvae TaxID=1811225 RepID=A0ABT2BDL4_9BURK|nr:MarR family transcriptional regulator [Massilia solisilvae]MCS0606557.1 MarR family transcriptional regulator [Massilia solisilvae]
MTKKEDNPSAWPLLLTGHAVLTGMIERRLADAGLPPLAWYDVLWALERAPQHRQRMHELADYVVLTRSNLTRLVDRLETAGLLRRESDPEDKRGAYAVLEPAGLAMRKKMWATYSAAIHELFDAHLSAVEQKAIGSALRKVISAARAR